MGFSISLLVFSVSYDEKWIDVLLLFSGRILPLFESSGEETAPFWQLQTLHG